jgi:inner membrane protein involved in colicin E2 resistance
MEQLQKKPHYTKNWMGLQILFVAGISIALAILANTISDIAWDHKELCQLEEKSYYNLINTITYCFSVIATTLMSITLIEIAVRKPINYIQYALIACALCLFNQLLFAMAELMPFPAAYTLVAIMTITLISCFVNGLTKSKKCVALTAGILTVEYGVIFTLINIGSMALLIGSLLLFVLIAVAMYFTLKLKVENYELVIK